MPQAKLARQQMNNDAAIGFGTVTSLSGGPTRRGESIQNLFLELSNRATEGSISTDHFEAYNFCSNFLVDWSLRAL
jgi:hypothetical protein